MFGGERDLRGEAGGGVTGRSIDEIADRVRTQLEIRARNAESARGQSLWHVARAEGSVGSDLAAENRELRRLHSVAAGRVVMLERRVRELEAATHRRGCGCIKFSCTIPNYHGEGPRP